ncbi:MAG: ABC transporter ATP-binding protein [Firmicutes bacterium]|nr:ABC transporter ATP-binding protein [Bacillota bacterium]
MSSLLDSVTSDEPKPALLEVEELLVRFRVSGSLGTPHFVVPVDRVSFTIQKRDVLALVGESGSGKSTIARSLVRVIEPTSGAIRLDGFDVTHARRKALQSYRRRVQMIFQDPFGSLNPVRSVAQHLRFPVRHFGRATASQEWERMAELLNLVGLTPAHDVLDRFPHELSGGQRQRVAIARALAASPELLVADEPISMLDVSIRAGILKLLMRLKEEMQMGFLYITHDLASARYFGDRIMVMYGGRVMETAPSRDVIAHPAHPYTRLLLAATPGGPRGALPETSNQPPDLRAQRQGCPFAARCPAVTAICQEQEPEPRTLESGHVVMCHHPS